jgi:Hemerythrin HHE cation binding domain
MGDSYGPRYRLHPLAHRTGHESAPGHADDLTLPRRNCLYSGQCRVSVADCASHGGTVTEGIILLPAPDRTAALSEQLIHVHQALRERLASLRQEAADGTGHRATDTATGEDLLSHCLSFCTAIHTHQSGEDSQLLPALRAAAPELAPVIDNLTEDHALVAGILRQVRELLTPGRIPSGPDALVRELDGLIAILESHFSYEERRIAKALDTLP